MKILYITTIGITMGFFETFIKEQLDIGNQIDIATNEHDGKDPVPSCYREWGCKIYHLDTSRSPVSLGNIRAIKQIRELVNRNHYDMVHCHTPLAAAATRMACKHFRKHGLKVVYTAHGFHFYDGAPLKNWLIYYPIEKFLSRYTDAIITINQEDYKRACECFYAEKTYHIPGIGFDTKKFSTCKVDRVSKRLELGVRETDFLMLSVGELSDHKNQKIIIEALNKMNLDDTLGNIVYLAVGAGDKEFELKKSVKEYGLDRYVKFLGRRTDIAELCKTVDCFIHPSIREGLGIAPLEGMAAGLPLISSYVGGIRDYTDDGVSGCCIAPFSVDAMVAAIKRMRDDKEFRIRCGSNNSKIAEKYDKNNSNAIMAKIYKTVCLEK